MSQLQLPPRSAYCAEPVVIFGYSTLIVLFNLNYLLTTLILQHGGFYGQIGRVYMLTIPMLCETKTPNAGEFTYFVSHRRGISKYAPINVPVSIL